MLGNFREFQPLSCNLLGNSLEFQPLPQPKPWQLSSHHILAFLPPHLLSNLLPCRLLDLLLSCLPCHLLSFLPCHLLDLLLLNLVAYLIPLPQVLQTGLYLPSFATSQPIQASTSFQPSSPALLKHPLPTFSHFLSPLFSFFQLYEPGHTCHYIKCLTGRIMPILSILNA